MPPGSSKIVPESLRDIDGSHFGDPWDSNLTPWMPKVTPGVPKVTPLASPRLQKGAFWVLKATPAALLVLIFTSFSCPVFAILLPAGPSSPRHTAPSTLRPNNPSTLLRYKKGPAECAERLNKQNYTELIRIILNYRELIRIIKNERELIRMIQNY